MSKSGESVSTERERLIFGAGFAFGVMFTMLILAVTVAATVTGPALGVLTGSTVLWPIASAFALAAVVGFGLYFLALPDRGFGFRDEGLLDDEAEIETK